MADFGAGPFDQVFDAIQVLFAVTNTSVRHWTFDDVTSVHTAPAPTHVAFTYYHFVIAPLLELLRGKMVKAPRLVAHISIIPTPSATATTHNPPHSL